MNFKDIEAFIPYGQYGEKHTQELTVWERGDERIAVRQPGKYQDKTTGGDAVVCYTGLLNDREVKNKQVTYQDIFKQWVDIDPEIRQFALKEWSKGRFDGAGVLAMAVLVLTVAEYRRYKQHERCTTASYGFPVELSDGTVKLYTGGRWLLLNYLTLLHSRPDLLDVACGVVKLGSNGLRMLENM